MSKLPGNQYCPIELQMRKAGFLAQLLIKPHDALTPTEVDLLAILAFDPDIQTILTRAKENETPRQP